MPLTRSDDYLSPGRPLLPRALCGQAGPHQSSGLTPDTVAGGPVAVRLAVPGEDAWTNTPRPANKGKRMMARDSPELETGRQAGRNGGRRRWSWMHGFSEQVITGLTVFPPTKSFSAMARVAAWAH